MTDVGQTEVLAWMARTGLGASEAVDHFWPGADPERRSKLAGKFRLWRHRAGQPAQRTANAPQGDDEPGPAPTRIIVEPRHALPASMERVAFLEWQLSQLVATMEAVMAQGNVGRVAQIDARISEVRLHLDSARSENRPVTLDRNPAAVAEAVERRAKQIASMAAAKQLARERDL